MLLLFSIFGGGWEAFCLLTRTRFPARWRCFARRDTTYFLLCGVPVKALGRVGDADGAGAT